MVAACVPTSADLNVSNDDSAGSRVSIQGMEPSTGSRGSIDIDATGQTLVLDARGREVSSICSRLRLDGGFQLYESSKKYLFDYYKNRQLKELFIAWYFSEDSKFLAMGVRKCPDKKNKHFYALKTLLRKNAIIQDLIAVNMRTAEHANLTEIYLDDYERLFPTDIK